MKDSEKIKKLGERISQLESYVGFQKWINEDRTKEARIWKKITSDNKGFEENFIKKYSVKEYRNKGFEKEFEQLDFKTVIDKAGKLGDGSKKLKFWMDFQRKMINTIGIYDYEMSEYWAELKWFAKCAVNYYQDAIIERILQEGKHFEGSGRKAETKEKEIGLNVYKESVVSG